MQNNVKDSYMNQIPKSSIALFAQRMKTELDDIKNRTSVLIHAADDQFDRSHPSLAEYCSPAEVYFSYREKYLKSVLALGELIRQDPQELLDSIDEDSVVEMAECVEMKKDSFLREKIDQSSYFHEEVVVLVKRYYNLCISLIITSNEASSVTPATAMADAFTKANR